MSTTKQKVIDFGLEFLHGAGADHICGVCIPNGGSCCSGCRSLRNGIGCRNRNTSCTAWLCGFLKYIFYEAGIIHEWEQFWEQVPGQSYREDFTPLYFTVHKWPDIPKIRFLSEAFAEDLKELKPYKNPFWLIEIREALDQCIDNILERSDPEIKRKYAKKLKSLTSDFRHFQSAKAHLLHV